jgi:pSer/pThr/pTyr-binding forkhead associated (FHA) protein
VSELTLMLIRFAYLAILWIFVLSAISVVRSDMFGARVDSTPRADRKAEKQARRQGRSGSSQSRTKPAKRPRGAPTHVAVTEGANAGQTVPLDEAPILIGRGADAAIRLDDDYVSTRHARIASSGDQWFVEDLGSTNGTYIGAHRLTQPTTLQLGSTVRIGKTTLELRK